MEIVTAERPDPAVNEVLVASGRPRAHADRTFALEEAAKAHALGESSGFVGKLVPIPGRDPGARS
ncbi:zinc-binding dehydrogenase [Nonomuraea phyllanthi]|uniref:Zinc-binding dehydrogenase n=1 Tax=Nonomuraea phyllanthi TaxID=2219224 RepID=A0A5C4VHD8_9ACTN|nr:zinc-binding dehydrogenase [Nonomuraea phyllanthi]QFY09502.1 zinc-binding dehydrogenase [Nonomuraea phyllanthi]